MTPSLYLVSLVSSTEFATVDNGFGSLFYLGPGVILGNLAWIIVHRKEGSITLGNLKASVIGLVIMLIGIVFW